MNFLPHQIPGSATACRHPIIAGHYCVKAERKDGKSMDLVSGVCPASAATFHSLEEAKHAADTMNSGYWVPRCIEQADERLKLGGLPAYSELLKALRSEVNALNALGFKCAESAALLARLPA